MSDQDSDYGGSIGWQNSLQIHRLSITNRIVYRRLSPFLKKNFIFDQDDDEEVSNAVLYPTEQSRMNRVVDKLMRKGEDNFNEFVKILADTYPDLYKSITGNEAPPSECPFPTMPTANEEVVNILLERLEAKKQDCEQLRKLNIHTQRELEEKTREVSQHQNHIQELKRRGERYESMERDMAALKDVVDQVKNDNYKFCMRLVDINEENSRLRERNMAMRIEIDMKDTNLRKMKSTVDSERRQSLRYRTRIENGPSPQLISNLHGQIEELKLQLAQAKQTPIPTDDNDTGTRIQILQNDKDEALQMCAENSEKLNRLREEFNTAETLRDKYLEENERFRLQVSALTDDCDMYKTRRDAVWQQLQEVEKERDQLMKERNEAQITAQNHMDEKTKYRTEIRQLEERLDERSFQLREKEAKLRELRTQLEKQTPSLPGDKVSSQQSHDTSTASDKSPGPCPGWKCNRPRAYNIKHYSEFMVKSEFEVTMEARNNSIGADGEFPEIPLAKNYGNGCGNISGPKKPRSESDSSRKHSRAENRDFRKAIRIKERNTSSSKLKTNSETHSRSSSTDSEQPSKSADAIMVEIESKAFQECVRFIGGNKSGIFVNQIIESQSSNYTPGRLIPGLRLVKIRESQKEAHVVSGWTLEHTYDFIRSLEGVLILILEPGHKEYQELKDKSKSFKSTGDSFHVRANFNWCHENMLNFAKFEVLHVVNTQPQSNEMHWVACKTDLYNGSNSSRFEVIPSLKYCLKHPFQVDSTHKTRALSEPKLFVPQDLGADRRAHSPVSVRIPSSLVSLVIGRPDLTLNGRPEPPKTKHYTLMRSVEIPKDKPRPCLFLPQSIAKILCFRLTTKANPLIFDFPYPESTNCATSTARFRLYDHDVISFKSISEDSHEVVTISSVNKVIQAGKHCILSINENCISIKEYLRKLHEEDIYPIVILLQTENKKTVKTFIGEDRTKQSVALQDMMLTHEQLKRFGCNFVAINLDRCNKVDDAVNLVMEKVADETNRIVWREDDTSVRI